MAKIENTHQRAVELAGIYEQTSPVIWIQRAASIIVSIARIGEDNIAANAEEVHDTLLALMVQMPSTLLEIATEKADEALIESQRIHEQELFDDLEQQFNEGDNK